ncbi:hypothetical protein N7456_003781 [Penicillium angulare]|uniref:Cytochrome P450 n=1 Tax=Penicillium angulare TaxID=116970 RepID=A0A9W9FVB7_9EURO|nr:hypothetical protein N7456_003781 [Penicillium angulare]
MSLFQEQRFLAQCTLASVSGPLTHHFLFKKNEWHMQGPQIIKSLSGIYAGLVLIEAGRSLNITGLWHASIIFAIFITSLLGSIVFYRVFAHRTHHFPGPRLAAVSKFWHSYQCIGGQNHLLLDRLHNEYGDFVRTGPSEITIFHPEVLLRLDGPGSKTQKSDWYDVLLPHVGLATIRNRPFHDQRRRLWTKGFSTRAIVGYEAEIKTHARALDSLISKDIAKSCSSPLSTYIYWFAFDIMGHFAFSRSFDMLSKGDWHHAIQDLRGALGILGPLSPVPWLARIGFWALKRHWIMRDWNNTISFCGAQMKRRFQEPNSHDVAQAIIDEAKKNQRGADDPCLIGDSIVAIVAGSDTVAPTLVFIFYQLALNPKKAEKLFEEVHDFDLENTNVKNYRYLKDVIMETLRLHPAVPTAGYRDTPPEGITIGGTFIPGNTTIVAPRYTLGRLECCYKKPTEWIPERWSTQPELVKDSRSFLPFAQGRYTCLGKDVAMAEMATLVALLVSKYHISFPNDGGVSQRVVEEEMTDQFTATPGNMNLVFSPRESRSHMETFAN